MAYDLGFDGAPVFYSWPSQGAVGAYTTDEQNIEWAETNIRHFLSDFLAISEAKRICVIAHSMGTRAVARAIASLASERPDWGSRIHELILTAPDIDAAVFRRDIAPMLIEAKQSLTLYSSSEDIALRASRKVHGSPRAGESGEELVVLQGLETIDATGVDTSFLRHSYFAEARSVLSDIFYIVRNSLRASQRFGLRSLQSPDGQYWKFEKIDD